MKIETNIKPRRDGNVIADVDGTKYTFLPDEFGALVANVENEEHIAVLCARSDDFLPVDDADFDRADALVAGAANTEGEGEKADEAADEEDEDPPDMNAAPIEEPASVVAAERSEPKAAKATRGGKK